MAWTEKTSSGRYRIRDRDGQGKVFTAVKDAGVYSATADEICRKYEDQQSRESAGVPTPDTPIFDAITRWLNIKPLSPLSLTKYRSDIERFAKHSNIRTLGDITDTVIEKWVTGMRSGSIIYSRGTLPIRYNEHGINSSLSSLRVFCRFCVARGWLRSDILKAIVIHQVESPRRFLKREDVIRFIRACKTDTYLNRGTITRRKSDNSLRRIMLFGLYTGLRASEVLAAQWENIDQNWILFIPKAKKHLQRSVPIPPRLRLLLGRRRLGTSGRVFDGWDKNKLSQMRRRAMARSGLGRVRFHDLRHSFVRNFLKSGAGDIAQLRGITGHRSLASLQTYAHFAAADLADGMAKVRIQ